MTDRAQSNVGFAPEATIPQMARWARNELMRCNKSWGGLEFCCQTFSSSSKVLACFRSSVSKPSVNQP